MLFVSKIALVTIVGSLPVQRIQAINKLSVSANHTLLNCSDLVQVGVAFNIIDCSFYYIEQQW